MQDSSAAPTVSNNMFSNGTPLDFHEVGQMVAEQTQSKTTTAQVARDVEAIVANAFQEFQDEQSKAQSLNYVATGETFEVAASKRSRKGLDSVDLNLEPS